jgi:hypothetical protein
VICYIENLFNEDELLDLFKCIDKGKGVNDLTLGRQKIEINNLPRYIENNLEKIGSSLYNKNLAFSYCLYVSYSKEYGQPNLPPHIDADSNDLIFNYQIRSNTSWDLGLGVKNYNMKDNSCLIFDPNAEIHWRPHKNFKDGESLEMVLFRLVDTDNPTDRSNLSYMQNDPIFKDAIDFRNKLGDNVNHG